MRNFLSLAGMAALLLALLHPGGAHAQQRDQVLQSMTVELAPGRLAIQVQVTPGAAMADDLLGLIDLDGDAMISPLEQRYFTSYLRDSWRFKLDGEMLPMRPVSARFPDAGQMRAGNGTIFLAFEAPIPGDDLPHRLLLEQHNAPQIKGRIYRVDTLASHDLRVQLLDQQRNQDQSQYMLDFRIMRAGAVAMPRQYVAGTGVVAVMANAFLHGIVHILTGYDHLLFACALMLAAPSVRRLVVLVTAFTMAHASTMVLASFELVPLPGKLMAVAIAACIVITALQNIHRPGQASGHSRVLVAVLFGLFHGLGFAGGLLALAQTMPPFTRAAALGGFSVGLEIGNLCLVAALSVLLWCLGKVFCKTPALLDTWRERVQWGGSIAIALAGLYYLRLALVES